MSLHDAASQDAEHGQDSPDVAQDSPDVAQDSLDVASQVSEDSAIKWNFLT
jgi:hypothetical protein